MTHRNLPLPPEGRLRLVSSVTVYNELLSQSPELIDRL